MHGPIEACTLSAETGCQVGRALPVKRPSSPTPYSGVLHVGSDHEGTATYRLNRVHRDLSKRTVAGLGLGIRGGAAAA